MIVELDNSFVERLKKELNTDNIVEAIHKALDFYEQNVSNDIEIISKDDPDYQIILKAREERIKHPENYGTINDVDWN